jgi:tetratricopeptide (TPR) repeat protein
VKPLPPVDGETFVATLKPLLERQDLQGLVVAVRARWECSQILPLLASDSEDVRKVALLTLAWVGGKDCIPSLLKQLRSDDEVIHSMAEHALWSVFFRAGTPQANQHVCRGAKSMDAGKLDEAIVYFTKAVEADPSFSEAFNQRAVAHYLKEEFRRSIDDCDEAIERIPCHFGAWSGKGHALLQLGHLMDAADCYRKALELHPHMGGVKETLEEIELRLKLV